MKTKNQNYQFVKQTFIMPIFIFSLLLYSCKTEAQENNEHKGYQEKHEESSNHKHEGEGQKKESKSHDYNGKGHEKKGSGHDKDGKGHGEEVKGHDKDGDGHEGKGEHTDMKGEETGSELSLNDTYDKTKYGIHLVLKYDKSSNTFRGIVKNTTDQKIKKVRIEVHLSNGIELGPTKPVNLGAKMKKDVVLKATSIKFNSWSTHAEIGNSEHEGEKEGSKEHDGKQGGEHN